MYKILLSLVFVLLPGIHAGADWMPMKAQVANVSPTMVTDVGIPVPDSPMDRLCRSRRPPRSCQAMMSLALDVMLPMTAVPSGAFPRQRFD